MWKYAKYIKNQGLNKCQYCFAYISATKASIFIRFNTQAHKIVKNHVNKFHKDPCIYPRTRRENVRARRNVRAHVYAPCGRFCTWIFTKFFAVNLYYLMSLSLKFHKDRSFGYRNIWKTILTSVWSSIINVFSIFPQIFSSKASKDG